MATLKEIAKECQVSVATVSNILNGKPKVSEATKKRVLEAIDRLGYRPNYYAQGLRRQKTKTIGIIAEDIAQFTTPEIIEGIMEYCEEHEFRVLLLNLRLYARWVDKWYDNNELVKSVLDPAVKELSSIKVDGMIYVAGHERKINYFSESMPFPTVLSYCYADNDYSSVMIDDEQGGYDITKYILSMGHKKIGVIGGRVDNIHAANRLLGYQRAMFEAKQLYDPSLVKYCDWNSELAYEKTKELINEGVTAIFSMSDRMAGAVFGCITDMGLTVGKDIAVVGYDNEKAAEWYVPRLTTVSLPLREVGQTTAKILIEKLEAKDNPVEVVHEKIPCELIIRKSVQSIGENN